MRRSPWTRRWTGPGPDRRGHPHRTSDRRAAVMTFAEAMEHVAQVFEAIGALVLLIGLFVSVALGVRDFRRTRDGGRAYRVLRQAFGGVILLGLEILVAADLVRTVAVAPTL